MKSKNKYFYLITVVLLITGTHIESKDSYTYISPDLDPLRNIRFIPEAFMDVELWNNTEKNRCSPGFAENEWKINHIDLNTPDSIFYNSQKEINPVIPVCMRYMISLRRSYKYYKLEAQLVNVRRMEDGETFSGEIVELPSLWINLPYRYSWRDKIRILIERIKALTYSEAQLDKGQSGGGYKNFNVMDFVDIPFLPGKYEIWVSSVNLESNHTFVEIIPE